MDGIPGTRGPQENLSIGLEDIVRQLESRLSSGTLLKSRVGQSQSIPICRRSDSRQFADKENIQLAKTAMIVDRQIASVIAKTITRRNSGTIYLKGEGVLPLGTRCIVASTTEYFYCWDASGRIRQYLTAGPC